MTMGFWFQIDKENLIGRLQVAAFRDLRVSLRSGSLDAYLWGLGERKDEDGNPKLHVMPPAVLVLEETARSFRAIQPPSPLVNAVVL
jgi:hypothetical protein